MPVFKYIDNCESNDYSMVEISDALLLYVVFYYSDNSFGSKSRYNADIKILMNNGDVFRYDPFYDGGEFQIGRFGTDELKKIVHNKCFYKVCKWKSEWITHLQTHLLNITHEKWLGFPIYTVGSRNTEISKIAEDGEVVSIGTFNEESILDFKHVGIISAMTKYTELFWGEK